MSRHPNEPDSAVVGFAASMALMLLIFAFAFFS